MGAKQSSLSSEAVGTSKKPLSDASILNQFNAGKEQLPGKSDVVVIGGGIHALIYAIHAKTLEIGPLAATTTTMTVLEKSSSPGYKIGESTLTTFGVWLKSIGIESPMLWRLFGPKDGLAFYYFSSTGDPENYTQFVANGPPGDFVPTLQIERKISELMLTLHAQRLGITVLHGREVDIKGIVPADDSTRTTVPVRNCETSKEELMEGRLLIDATGRFHRLVSNESRIEKVDGLNTHAFWAYFHQSGDESHFPLRNYESANTNHICLAEGWAWVIRLPSWEGSSIENLTAMINHLLDLNAAKTPGDLYPSVDELVKTFNLKFRWVVSIGFALRSDVQYPADLSTFGRSEAEQKFNWIVSRYEKVGSLMEKHNLIEDLYGPGTTWFARKNLAFRSPRVTGKNWMAIGDATGFTNPLYSPGINANMSTSIYAAEMTKAYLSTEGSFERHSLMQKYEEFCRDRVPNLQRMNVFNYVCMRSPQLGPLGPLWQYLCGTGNAKIQNAKEYDSYNVGELLTTWEWGAQSEEYIAFAKLAIQLLDGPPHVELTQKTIDDVKKLSAAHLTKTISTGKYTGRWAGLLRWYDDELNFVKDKVDRDILARRKCAFCGWEHSVEESTKVLYTLK
ncbi:hypothetical protein CJF30_00002624 [Rutstroemia sp. NJR-2017a BBW]|nr:hypothetical protein CJF30_00002624 [Rutstroemia sp. NJR-2017a BBW]